MRWRRTAAAALAVWAPAAWAADATQAYDDATAAMCEAMDAPMPENADESYARRMIAHHEGAVALAQAELLYGSDPTLREMAAEEIDMQTRAIEQLRAWLETRVEDGPEGGQAP